MSKKGKSKRREQYKAFMDGMLKYREKFIDKKIGLIEKMLNDEALKNKIMAKNRREMNKLERAAVDTLNVRELNNVQDFDALKASLKDSQSKRAKFKYTIKEI